MKTAEIKSKRSLRKYHEMGRRTGSIEWPEAFDGGHNARRDVRFGESLVIRGTSVSLEYAASNGEWVPLDVHFKALQVDVPERSNFVV